jgi:hypothetical protein
MGEKQNQPFRLSFNASLRVDFRGSRVTSDGGLIVVRELYGWPRSAVAVQRHVLDALRTRPG